MLEAKEKKCSGINKAKMVKGCGKLTKHRTFGLCVNCLHDFLFESDAGKLILQKRIIPQAKNKVVKEQKKVIKEQKKVDSVARESLKTKKDYLNIAQKVFNTYIRLRDKNKPCVSCGKHLKDNDINASHYFSVGSSPNLRFNEDNVHNSCIRCNKELHGNISEYAIRLPLRIGKERFEQLIQDRNKPALYSINDVKDIISTYKEKIKCLNNK